MEAPWAARSGMLSFSGTFVLPALRLTISDWLTDGGVNYVVSAAAAAFMELTPGTIS